MLSTGRLFSPKPQKPRKPQLRSKSPCPLPAGRGTTPVGRNSQVKQIVEHLNQQGVVFSPKTEDGGQLYGEPKPTPIIKHRPLPQPQSNRPSEETGKQEVQQKEDIEDGQSVSAQGGRPAPEGMEMEAEVKHHEEEETGLGSAVSPHLFCRTSCTCICHQQRPGMRLVWVPADEEETRKEGKDAGSEGGRQRMMDRVTTRGEAIEKSGQEEGMKFQKVPDAITRDWNSEECSQTPILNPPKFYHRSHWSSPACSQSQQTQLSPKISQDTPPPVPPRLDLQLIKFKNQGSHSSSSSSSSSSPGGRNVPPE
ncbi:hypothetical protein GJAV_G00125780 [Gymnothorax javanicus]|nr:hypothetical protein GJAV_G00125780 [Gymnothorax javanicus]